MITKRLLPVVLALVIVTVAGAEKAVPLLALYVNESEVAAEESLA